LFGWRQQNGGLHQQPRVCNESPMNSVRRLKGLKFCVAKNGWIMM